MVPIDVEEEVRIPGNVANVEAFRRWAVSDDFPERGRFAFLRDAVWVDLSMEQLFTHNRVKTRITSILDDLATAHDVGYFFSDRALLTHPEVGLSTEPDGLFVAYDTIQKGRVQIVEGRAGGHVELLGSPDMVLEVVSARSERKDTETLRQLYWEAAVPEYWLVDARGAEPRFDLLVRKPRGYAAARKQGGWARSPVFARSFQLKRQTDPLGHPQFSLSVR